jgi:glycosyltransferase involved in cell wall biosynthesis
LRHPGIVVLHEFDLHGFYVNRTRPDNAAAYIREMGYAYGPDGAHEARLILAGRCSVPSGTRPLFNRIVDVSPGVIVHTEYARRILLATSPRARVAHIPLAASQSSVDGSIHLPTLFKQFPPGTIVLASFGYIAPSKRIESILRALAQVRAEISNFRYVLVGEPVPECDFRPLIDDLGLTDIVHVTGFVDDAEFQAYLNSVDIGVNLRTGPTGGEMSAAVVRLLASGRPTIVSDVGGFSDLPGECVVKVRQDEDEVAQLVTALRYLIVDAQARAAYGEAARRYVLREFAFPVVAQKYATFIRECLESIVDTAGNFC